MASGHNGRCRKQGEATTRESGLLASPKALDSTCLYRSQVVELLGASGDLAACGRTVSGLLGLVSVTVDILERWIEVGMQR